MLQKSKTAKRRTCPASCSLIASIVDCAGTHNHETPSAADAANNTMFKLNNWFLANKLSLNTDKTFYMVFPPDTSIMLRYKKLPIAGILELLLMKS